MNDNELQKLITELQLGNDRERRAAAYKLGKSKDPTVVPVLINAFNDPDGTVRQNVRDGLRNIGSPEAMDCLNSNATAQLISVASGESKLSGELQKLVTELQQGNDRQRRAAAYKLGKSKNPAVVPALINAFNDPDSSVRQNVRDGLRSISSQEALDCLNSNGKVPLVVDLVETKPSETGTLPTQDAALHIPAKNAKAQAPAPNAIVQTPTVLLENPNWKITRLGGVLGDTPIVVHANTQRIVAYHVSGFLGSKTEFRIYFVNENSFSYEAYPGEGSPSPRFSNSGKYILLPQNGISNAVVPGWNVLGSLVKVDEGLVIRFRNHLTMAGGVHGTGYAEFSPNETLVALGNFYNSKVHIVDMDSLANGTPFYGDRQASVFVWDQELETSGDMANTICLRWSPDGSALAHVTSSYAKSYYLVLWRFSDGDRVDALKKIHEVISRGEKVQPEQIARETMSKVKDSQTLKLNDFSGEVSFSPDSQYLAMGGGKAAAVRIVDVTKTALIHEEPSVGAEICSLSFLSDGKHLVGADENGMLYLWSVDFSAEKSKLELAEKNQISKKTPFLSLSSQEPIGIVAVNDVKGSVNVYQVEVLLK